MRQRLDARTRPWNVTTWLLASTPSMTAATPWHEFDDVDRTRDPERQRPRPGRPTRRGSATRDQLIEVEAYPRLRAGTYAFVGVGTGTRRDLFPDYRAAFDLYQSLGHGIEVSGGYRRLQFSAPVSIYVGSATKYLRSVGPHGARRSSCRATSRTRGRFTPSRGDTSAARARAIVAATYSHGFNREEPRGVGDSIQLRSNTVRGQANLDVVAADPCDDHGQHQPAGARAQDAAVADDRDRRHGLQVLMRRPVIRLWRRARCSWRLYYRTLLGTARPLQRRPRDGGCGDAPRHRREPASPSRPDGTPTRSSRRSV